jgi:peroxiredoxin
MSQVASVPTARANRADWFVLVLLALSLGLNVLMGVMIVRFSTPTTPAITMLKTGSEVPALQVETLQGTAATIKYDEVSTPTVLYVFTPSCQWCAKNLDNLRTLAQSARAGKYRLVGISLDPNVSQYLKDEGLDFDVYVKPSLETLQSYGFGVTPQTFIISNTGKLQKMLNGAYVGQSQADLEAHLGLKLPGLKQSPAKASMN